MIPVTYFVNTICSVVLICSLIIYYNKQNKTKLFTVSILTLIVLLILYFAILFPLLILFIIIPGLPPF